jgi:hypothetical protein
MTIQEIAKREAISERSAQRYVTVGYKGHVLKATRMRKAFVIAEDDYKLWRLECGFDFLPQPAGSEPPPSAVDVVRNRTTVTTPAVPAADSAARLSFEEIKRRYFSPDRIGGPITNVPAFGSGSMCSPSTAKLYHEACARRMKAQLRGYENEDE